jgi:cation:H+ antiporter
MFFATLLIVAGGVFLFQGARFLVHGGSVIALRLRIPAVVVGLTIVAFGTSAPELFLSLASALNGAPYLAVGNILGSNVANVLLILGCAAVIRPVVVQRSTMARDLPLLTAGSVLLLLFANDRWFSLIAANQLGIRDGLVLFALFGVFLYALLLEKGMDGMRLIEHFRFRRAYKVSVLTRHSIPKALLEVAVSVFALWFGAVLFVRGAETVGLALRIPEEVLGLTLAALGTSLPELATTLVAAWRREADIAVGNIIGSNVFNLLFILGAVAVAAPLPWTPAFNVDVGAHLAALALLGVVLWWGRKKGEIDRREGALMIGAYILYVASLFGRFFG